MFERESWDNQTCGASHGWIALIYSCAQCAHQRKVCTMWVQLFVPHVFVIHTTKSRVAVLCLSVLLVVSYMLRDTLSVRSLSLHGGLVHKLTVSVTHPIHCYLISCAHLNRSWSWNPLIDILCVVYWTTRGNGLELLWSIAKASRSKIIISISSVK